MTSMRPGGRTVIHHAKYSREVLVLMRFLLPPNSRVHDPFAGTGSRLGDIADERCWLMTGTELEGPFIEDARIVQGDACDPSTYPAPLACPVCQSVQPHTGMHLDKRPLLIDPNAGNISMCTGHARGYSIVTSPVYPNGMADSWKKRDDSKHKTYRTALAATTGVDRELHEHNMGRWGYRGNALGVNRQMYWHIARKAIACWSSAEQLIVNVSDSISGDRTLPVVREWVAALEEAGWRDIEQHPVVTPRDRSSQHGDRRVDNEVVLVTRGRS